MFNYLSPRRNYDVSRSLWDELFSPNFFTANSSAMKTDIRETEKEYLLDVELPGYNKEDVEVTIDNGYLTIATKKNSENEEKNEGNYIHRERYSVSASRSWYVGNVDRTMIKASFNNGILTVSVPKDELPEKETSNIIDID